MFDEKFYSNTVINAEASILRAETAINSANSNIVKRGHGAVQEFCRRAIEWRSIGVHVEIMGQETNEFVVCSCGLRLHGKSIDEAVGHLDAQQQPTKLFVRNFELYHYEVFCQECGARRKTLKPHHFEPAQEDLGQLEHRLKGCQEITVPKSSCAET